MSLDRNGFNARRFVDIRDEMFNEMVTNLAIELDTSPNQVLSIITNIFSSSVTDLEELAQAVSDNFNIDKAQGKYLDDLVALTKLRRLDRGFSTGIVHVRSSNVSSNIPVGTVFIDRQGNRFTTTTPTNVSGLSCTEAVIVPDAQSGTFSITINGNTYTEVFDSSVAANPLILRLWFLLTTSGDTSFTVEVVNDSLVIDKVDKSSPFSVTVSPTLRINSVEVISRVRALEFGPISPEIGSVNQVASPLAGLISLTNYFRFSLGRDRETDEQLRARHASSSQISGSATAAAIFSKLSNIIGVSQVRVFENKTNQTNSSGLPPKSFECIVQGGDENTIGQTIYDTMPVGVQTFGSITSLVRDYSGNVEAVRWSRPQQVFINVQVIFSRYEEEDFPDRGLEAIREAVLEFGSRLSLDEDVIPQRFMGHIYRNVSGIGRMIVRVGTTIDPSSSTPSTPALGGIPYTTNPIPINARSIAVFDAIRVEVVQNDNFDECDL